MNGSILCTEGVYRQASSTSFDYSSTHTVSPEQFSTELHVAESSGAESPPISSAKVASALITEVRCTSRQRKPSVWTRHNPFAKDGRELLVRKILSSGPAHPSDALLDDVIDSDAVKPCPEWRKMIRLCCFAVMACIVTELVLLIWAAKTSVGDAGSGLLYKGNCDKVKHMLIWLLLPLNIVATILIGTSNYVMQVMVAPSRAEIDQAHSFARTVTVSGMNYRKSGHRYISLNQAFIWWFLILSSLPIHFLLNSSIYGSVQQIDYGVLVVSDNFETDSEWDICAHEYAQSSPSAIFACSMMQSHKSGKTKELSRSQCLLQYASGFQPNASSVIVVAEASSNPWYQPIPSSSDTARVPSSYGIACKWNGTQNQQVSDADRNFHFSYIPTSGTLDISLPFNVNCVADGKDGADEKLSAPANGVLQSYHTNGGLFHVVNDSLSNVTSLLSLFRVTDYRYWAAVEMTGDFLNDRYLGWLQGWNPTPWLCPKDDLIKNTLCDPMQLHTTQGWDITPSSISVMKCHALTKSEQCTLRYSWRILLVTIICDLVKLIAMICAVKSTSEPLTTLGDIIASFLQSPDPYTRHRCLLDHAEATKWTMKVLEKARPAIDEYNMSLVCGWGEEDIEDEHEHEDDAENRLPNGPDQNFAQMSRPIQNITDWVENGGLWWLTAVETPDSMQWIALSRRGLKVPPRGIWMILTVLYTSLMTATIIYLIYSLKLLKERQSPDVWSAGFNGPDPNALWEGGLVSTLKDITPTAILVNLPQVLFSTLYFALNTLFTIMHTAHEWVAFSKHCKALRVSSLRGQQRSTYWLQLPWSYSLPLIVGSGLIHWLLGRSVYLVKVEVYGNFGDPQPENDSFAIGYSPATVLALIILLALMGLALLIFACRKLEPGIPFVRLNSLAISAACHPDPSEKDIALQPLMWGVLKDKDGVDSSHCSFSAKEVSPLRDGQFYS